jgi:class 3 adenylate cyclase
MSVIAVVLLAVVASLVAVAAWWRALREVGRLRARLEMAADDLQRLQLSFSRFAPETVVDRIAASGVPTRPEKKEVTVLFADLVGFTALGERLDPADLVEILNGYFTRMSRVIADRRGHVSKFIGDGLMALFGVLERNPWQTNDAVHAALAMHAELERYNAELQRAGRERLALGIGVHCGVAVAGIVGSHELMEFTVIGGTVNFASRLQGLTRVHRVEIVVSDAISRSLDPRFRLRELPATAVRGIAEPVRAYAVEGFAEGEGASG